MGLRNFLFLFLIFTIISFQAVSADIISLNAGGNDELVINSDSYIEGFFFANVLCGDGLVEGAEQCDDGNTASGDGCSSTCTTEDSGDGGAGGGGGGGGGAPTPSPSISVEPDEFNIDIAINTNREETISVTNLGTSSVTLQVNQQNLDNYVILGATNITVQPGQSQDLDVVFVALSDPEIVTGKILIGSEEVLVTLNIKTEVLLFDSNIVVLNKDFKVEQGEELETSVTLIPFGDPTRLDVTLDFTIRDFSNNVYLTKSETLLVDSQVSLRRDFDTGNLPLGDYIIGLELIYPNGVAPSSANFEIVEKVPLGIFGRIVLFLIILILLILIAIIIILIWRRLQERRRQNQVG